jgi:hypothetical protein
MPWEDSWVVALAVLALVGWAAPALAQGASDVRDASHTVEDKAHEAVDLTKFGPGEPVDVRTIERGYYSGYEHRAFSAIDNEDEFERFWTQHKSPIRDPGATPDVDFEEKTVLVAFMGQSGCGGDAIRIDEVRRDGSDTAAYVSMERKNAVTDFTIGVVSNPYHIVKVPREDGLVAFTSREPVGEAVDAGLEAGPAWAAFCASIPDYRWVDAGLALGVDVVPAPASTVPGLVGSP